MNGIGAGSSSYYSKFGTIQQGMRTGQNQSVKGIENPQKKDDVTKENCQTCKERKYVDGSDEGNVSFKAPGHISPGASRSAVMSHENEHVTNAVREGNQKNKELVSVSVSVQMAVCQECGTTYAAGGTTSTTMKIYSQNPYDQARKSLEGSFLIGQTVNYAA